MTASLAMRHPSLFLLGVLALGAGGSQEREEEPKKPELVLDGPQAQTLSPGLAAKGMGKVFRITARLEGDFDDPEEFYCLDQVWEWGDGTESVQETDCDPYEPGAEIQRRFENSHAYTYGRFTVHLRLVKRDETVIRGTLEIGVY